LPRREIFIGMIEDPAAKTLQNSGEGRSVVHVDATAQEVEIQRRMPGMPRKRGRKAKAKMAAKAAKARPKAAKTRAKMAAKTRMKARLRDEAMYIVVIRSCISTKPCIKNKV